MEDYVGTASDMIGEWHEKTDTIAGHLNTKFGFEIFSRLMDSDATIANVEAAFESATSDLVDGDAFVFFFGGHGSTTVNQGTDEEDDNRDELRVLYDGIWYDDRLRTMIDAIPAGVKITIIFDSCLSGTGTRNITKPRVLPEESMRELLFSATAEGGLAYVLPSGGLFSTALEKHLNLCSNAITAKELYDRIKTENFWGLQEPQLEGPEALKNSRVFV